METRKDNKMRIEYTGNIEQFTLAIKHIMLDKNLKNKDICNATGWSKATVSNLLNNRTNNPSIGIILELCKAVDCHMCIDIVDNI